MKKVLKCRTFPKEDRITFDKGKDHVLITIEDKRHNSFRLLKPNRLNSLDNFLLSTGK